MFPSSQMGTKLKRGNRVIPKSGKYSQMVGAKKERGNRVIAKSGSSSSNSLRVHDAGAPQSIFVVVCYFASTPASISILRLNTQGNNDEPAAASPLTPKQDTEIRRRPSFSSFTSRLNHQKEYVAHFSRPRGPTTVSWLFSPLTSSSTCTSPEGLCMMPYWDRHPDDVLLNGCKFDFKTKMCKPIMHKGFNKSFGHVVNMSGCIYNLAQSFDRYDPANDSWKKLRPFPLHAAFQPRSKGFVLATAVWDDTILFNMGGSQIWAYYSPKNKWYLVDVKDIKCYLFVGEAVVLGNTIYALRHMSSDVVLALSITRTGIDVDFKFECYLRSEIFVQGMTGVEFNDAFARTEHLVHLGKDNFCLVESCLIFSPYLNGCQQPIHLTNIKLKEEDSKIMMTVTGGRQHMLRIVDDNQFRVVYCFSVPECNTIALKEGETSVFDIDPFPEDFDPERKHKFDTKVRNFFPFPSPAKSNLASKASTTLGDGADEKVEGHSIYVRDIPPTATFTQVEMELKKEFGPIKRNGIEVIINKDGSASAVVDFKRRLPEKDGIFVRVVSYLNWFSTVINFSLVKFDGLIIIR